MLTVLRACRLSETASEYFDKERKRLERLAKGNKVARREITQKKMISDMIELLHAFEENMGIDLETFLISKTS